MSQGRPPRLSPDISALSALTYVKEMLTHGMKGRRGGAEDERKWKGTQKPQETHVGRQAHFSIQRGNPLWPSTIQKVADSQTYSKRPGSQTAHSRVRQRKLKSVIKELDAFGVAKQKRRPCDTTQRGALRIILTEARFVAAWRYTTDFDLRLHHPKCSLQDSKSALLCCVASSLPPLVVALVRSPPLAPS